MVCPTGVTLNPVVFPVLHHYIAVHLFQHKLQRIAERCLHVGAGGRLVVGENEPTGFADDIDADDTHL